MVGLVESACKSHNRNIAVHLCTDAPRCSNTLIKLRRLDESFILMLFLYVFCSYFPISLCFILISQIYIYQLAPPCILFIFQLMEFESADKKESVEMLYQNNSHARSYAEGIKFFPGNPSFKSLQLCLQVNTSLSSSTSTSSVVGQLAVGKRFHHVERLL